MQQSKLLIMSALLLVGCEGFDMQSDETSTCTTNNAGTTTCRTKYKDTSYIDCRTYEDNSQSCRSSGMTADEVATVYDREDRIIDVDDEVVVIETAEEMIIVDIEE